MPQMRAEAGALAANIARARRISVVAVDGATILRMFSLPTVTCAKIEGLE